MKSSLIVEGFFDDFMQLRSRSHASPPFSTCRWQHGNNKPPSMKSSPELIPGIHLLFSRIPSPVPGNDWRCVTRAGRLPHRWGTARLVAHGAHHPGWLAFPAEPRVHVMDTQVQNLKFDGRIIDAKGWSMWTRRCTCIRRMMP